MYEIVRKIPDPEVQSPAIHEIDRIDLLFDLFTRVKDPIVRDNICFRIGELNFDSKLWNKDFILELIENEPIPEIADGLRTIFDLFD